APGYSTLAALTLSGLVAATAVVRGLGGIGDRGGGNEGGGTLSGRCIGVVERPRAVTPAEGVGGGTGEGMRGGGAPAAGGGALRNSDRLGSSCPRSKMVVASS